ncbi:hypothetical protein [Parvibaculum sedimenti]|uniref:hypothetical protein n=1 Tax=Parvibaculum sedimenti TaxID=2608632 RepID=UPI00163A9295|nr:hypothetical protein [Parvibaculum sedimenti]
MWIVLEHKRDLKQVPDFCGGRKVYRVAPAGLAENRHFIAFEASGPKRFLRENGPK